MPPPATTCPSTPNIGVPRVVSLIPAFSAAAMSFFSFAISARVLYN